MKQNKKQNGRNGTTFTLTFEVGCDLDDLEKRNVYHWGLRSKISGVIILCGRYDDKSNTVTTPRTPPENFRVRWMEMTSLVQTVEILFDSTSPWKHIIKKSDTFTLDLTFTVGDPMVSIKHHDEIHLCPRFYQDVTQKERITTILKKEMDCFLASGAAIPSDVVPSGTEYPTTRHREVVLYTIQTQSDHTFSNVLAYAHTRNEIMERWKEIDAISDKNPAWYTEFHIVRYTLGELVQLSTTRQKQNVPLWVWLKGTYPDGSTTILRTHRTEKQAQDYVEQYCGKARNREGVDTTEIVVFTLEKILDGYNQTTNVPILPKEKEIMTNIYGHFTCPTDIQHSWMDFLQGMHRHYYRLFCAPNVTDPDVLKRCMIRAQILYYNIKRHLEDPNRATMWTIHRKKQPHTRELYPFHLEYFEGIQYMKEIIEDDSITKIGANDDGSVKFEIVREDNNMFLPYIPIEQEKITARKLREQTHNIKLIWDILENNAEHYESVVMSSKEHTRAKRGFAFMQQILLKSLKNHYDFYESIAIVYHPKENTYGIRKMEPYGHTLLTDSLVDATAIIFDPNIIAIDDCWMYDEKDLPGSIEEIRQNFILPDDRYRNPLEHVEEFKTQEATGWDFKKSLFLS